MGRSSRVRWGMRSERCALGQLKTSTPVESGARAPSCHERRQWRPPQRAPPPQLREKTARTPAPALAPRCHLRLPLRPAHIFAALRKGETECREVPTTHGPSITNVDERGTRRSHDWIGAS